MQKKWPMFLLVLYGVLSLLITAYGFWSIKDASAIQLKYPEAIQPFWLGPGPFILVACAGICSALLFFLLWKGRGKKLSFAIGTVLICCLLCGTFAFRVNYQTEKNNLVADQEATNLINLTLVQLEKQLLISGEQIFYIGRDTCDSCKKAHSELEKIVEDHALTIYYYNTDQDRDSNSAAMYATLDKLGVRSVPSILVIKDGIAVQRFDSDDVCSELLNYLRIK